MIFLSYSNADVTSALVIKSALEAGGVRCWKAPEDIRPDERWAAAITRVIRASGTHSKLTLKFSVLMGLPETTPA
jgi:hypothetical protein